MAYHLGSDGLPVRKIKTHSLDKADRHRHYCGIFNAGMKGLWPENRGYLELFAGPGRCLHEEYGVEVDGCPLIAAASSFNRLVFVEFNPLLADALEQRLRARDVDASRAKVICGDANDPNVLEQALDFLPHPGLSFGFIDPEDLNGDWAAIEHLARARDFPRGQRMDFLLNFPIGSMKRNYDKDAAITRVLGTDEWIARVNAGEPLGRVFRETLAKQFERIGFDVARHREIRAFQGTTVYDLVFASADERGIKFWEKIEQIGPGGQRRFPGFENV